MKYTPILLCALCIALISSCSKSNSNSGSPAEAKLLGKWHYEQEITDLNGNGIIDAQDYHEYDSVNSYITFNVNGTGTYLSNFDPLQTFNWKLLASDTYLQIGDSSGADIYHIDTLSSTSLVLRDTATSFSNPIVWEVLKK
ncbi:MAG: hypothetical protein JSS96_11900 [Bacteroidetes bacterium]|nr:hypothetical protein [Bacteroidota bacterium]